MNRRRFLGTLFGLVAVPSIIVSALEATPKISTIVISSYPITSKRRKLKAKWSVELEQDLHCYHNISAQMSAAIQKEMDSEIIANINKNKI